MTRDSGLWWLGIVGALVLGISSRMDLIDPLLPPAHTDKVHALIELAAFVIGTISGLMKASPLPITDAGREAYYVKEFRDGK